LLALRRCAARWRQHGSYRRCCGPNVARTVGHRAEAAAVRRWRADRSISTCQLRFRWRAKPRSGSLAHALSGRAAGSVPRQAPRSLRSPCTPSCAIVVRLVPASPPRATARGQARLEAFGRIGARQQPFFQAAPKTQNARRATASYSAPSCNSALK
jgi:hypothetical protein